MTALRIHEKEMAAERSLQFQSFQTQHAVWKAEKESILRATKGKKKPSKIETETDLEALGPEPEAPPSTDRTVTEPTYEGLTRLFFEGQPSLGIFSDEGGQFLGGHGMNSDNRQKPFQPSMIYGEAVRYAVPVKEMDHSHSTDGDWPST